MQFPSQHAVTLQRKDGKKCKRWHRKYVTVLHSNGRELAGIGQLPWLSVLSYSKRTRKAIALIPCTTAIERSSDSSVGKSNRHLTRAITLPGAWQWIL